MPEEHHPADRHVLLVDDEPCFLVELGLYLRRRGWTVTTSQTPHEAQAQLDANTGITVVLTDVRLGNLDGFDLARRIRHERIGRRAVAVVVMTGHGELATVGNAAPPIELPILRKPLAVPHFLATLEAAFAKAQAARAT